MSLLVELQAKIKSDSECSDETQDKNATISVVWGAS